MKYICKYESGRKKFTTYIFVVTDDWVPETRVSEVTLRNEFKASLFFIFFVKFMTSLFDDFSKWSVSKVLLNFEKSSNMSKNW